MHQKSFRFGKMFTTSVRFFNSKKKWELNVFFGSDWARTEEVDSVYPSRPSQVNVLIRIATTLRRRCRRCRQLSSLLAQTWLELSSKVQPYEVAASKQVASTNIPETLNKFHLKISEVCYNIPSLPCIQSLPSPHRFEACANCPSTSSMRSRRPHRRRCSTAATRRPQSS